MSWTPCPVRSGGSPHITPFYLALPSVDLSSLNAYLFSQAISGKHRLLYPDP